MQSQVHFFLMKKCSWYKMQGPGGLSRTILLPKPALYQTRVILFCSGNSDPDLFDIYSGMLSDVYSGIVSGILSDINSDILSGILSDILFDIYSGMLSDVYSGILFGLLSCR